MSYATETPQPYERTYYVSVAHASLPVGFEFTIGQQNTTEANTDQAVQDFIDLIAASDDFEISTALKTNRSTQTIEPSE